MARRQTFQHIPTYPPILEKAPDGKVVDCRQASSEPLPGLLKCQLHPSNLLSARAIPTGENIGKGSRFVVRLVRQGLVHEVREKRAQFGQDRALKGMFYRRLLSFILFSRG
ncbi:hypothetical protein ACFL45_10340 [Candidatus Neomarinimicrobiota bacterium]